MRACHYAFLIAGWAVLAAPGFAETHYLHAGKLLDVEHGKLLSDQLVKIENDRIVSVTPWSGAPSDGPVIDWSRYEVLPGLTDMHAPRADTEQSNNVAEPLLHSAADIAYIGARH